MNCKIVYIMVAQVGQLLVDLLDSVHNDAQRVGQNCGETDKKLT